MKVIVYTLEVCPNCAELKRYLNTASVVYQEKDMGSAESMTELRIGGIHMMEAPVLQVGNTFIPSKSLFAPGGKVREYVIQDALARNTP